MKHAVKHIHFIGLGGSGMSGIAEVLHNLGYVISGSDLADSATLRRLASLGIRTFVGHAASNLASVDAVVTSTAVKADNPEVMEARAKRIPWTLDWYAVNRRLSAWLAGTPTARKPVVRPRGGRKTLTPALSRKRERG